MKMDWSLTPESLEKLLDWLDPDRDEAWNKFQQHKKRLAGFFTWRGCHIPEELADKTMDRVSKKVATGGVGHSVNRTAYCLGVAKNVLHEYWRDIDLDSITVDIPASRHEPDWNERELACLDECLDRLSQHDRGLVTRYHQYDRGEKIRARKELADEEGGPNALRIKVFRIRNALRNCFVECIKHDERAPLQ
jgi:hypothetical protein